MAKVSIVVATRNNEAIIEKCLDHIYAQKFKDFTCYIVDDGSTDQTLKIIKQEYPKTKIIIYKEPTYKYASFTKYPNTVIHLSHSIQLQIRFGHKVPT